MMPLERSDLKYPWHWNSRSLFYQGWFLSVDQVRDALEEYGARTPMLSKFRNAEQRFPELLNIYRNLDSFWLPVSRLRHVTVRDNFQNILDEEAFQGSDITFVLKGGWTNLRVSCWGPHPEDIEKAKAKHVCDFLKMLWESEVGTYHLSPQDKCELRDMMANSPAVNQNSRYGNFQFSFPFMDLLEVYRKQHCQGQKPVLRVLGTETFKLEIVYWVLIHSPHCRDFDHLPKLHRLGGLSWNGNQLWWDPESMTDQFTWYISYDTYQDAYLQKKPLTQHRKYGLMQTYDPWVWTNPVFAFHLPGDRALRMERSWLLQNVEGCETMKSFGRNCPRILRHPYRKYVSKQEAEDIIYNEKGY